MCGWACVDIHVCRCVKGMCEHSCVAEPPLPACVLPLVQLEVYYTSTNSTAIDEISIPIEISTLGLLSKSQEIIDVLTGDAWVASFCFKVDSQHVPGLLHSFNEATNQDHPDVSTTSNGISIFMRHYTVRVSASALRGAEIASF